MAVDPRKFEDNEVREDLYAPVFKGGVHKTVKDVDNEDSNTNLDIPLWVGIEGKTINNDGIKIIFNRKFLDVFQVRFSSAGF